MRFLSGLADCHLPGLYSLVLSERVSHEKGMRRIFYASQHCRMDLWDGADFRLKPHNHRQNITLQLLFGNVSNVALKLSEVHQGRGEFVVYEYAFGSALLNGEFSLNRIRMHAADLRHKDLTERPLYLHWSNIHTVVAAPGSAWLVEEFAVAPEGMGRCYSVSHRLKLSSDGLYRKMSQGELEEMESVFDSVAVA